jgi:hypothetical protein
MRKRVVVNRPGDSRDVCAQRGITAAFTREIIRAIRLLHQVVKGRAHCAAPGGGRVLCSLLHASTTNGIVSFVMANASWGRKGERYVFARRLNSFGNRSPGHACDAVPCVCHYSNSSHPRWTYLCYPFIRKECTHPLFPLRHHDG